MSEPTSDDPWRVTGEDAAVFGNAWNRRGTTWEDDLQVVVNRIRARVETAAPKRPTTTEPKFLLLGETVLDATKIVTAERDLKGGRVNVMTDGAVDPDRVRGASGVALWSYLTDPIRCVDLTPQAPKEDAS